MPNTEFRFTKNFFEGLKNQLIQDDKNENYCVILANSTDDIKANRIYFPDQLIGFPESAYERKGSVFLTLSSRNYKEVLKYFFSSDYKVLVSCHSHPFDNSGNVFFSGTDDSNDLNLFSEFRRIAATTEESDQYEMFSMVMTPKTMKIRQYDFNKKTFVYIPKITILNEKVEKIFYEKKELFRKNSNPIDEIHKRSYQAFGSDGMKQFQKLTVALVGVGGVGSILAEGLLRTGVKKIILIDYDKLEKSDLNRWQTGCLEDVGKYKVDIMARHLKHFNKNIEIETITGDVFSEKAQTDLKKVDLIMGCTDNHETRYFLNKVSIQYLIPYIDGGTIITHANDKIALPVRVSIVLPGVTKCMDCSALKSYQEDEAMKYFLRRDKATEIKFKKRGYIQDHPEIANPAVYPQNLTLASYMLQEFMNVFLGFKNLYWNISANYTDFEHSSEFNRDFAFSQQLSRDPGNPEKENSNASCSCHSLLGKGDCLNNMAFYLKTTG